MARTNQKRPALKKDKKCQFCEDKVKYVDYKNIPAIRRHTSQYAKIQPRYYSGVCLNHQKKLSRAIKLARFIGLLPFVR